MGLKSKAAIFIFNIWILMMTSSQEACAQSVGDSKLVYEWTSLDFDWPSENSRNESIDNGSFVPESNLLAGIKIYKGDVYLTIPRWRRNTGMPATLLKVVHVNGEPKLRPYPSWEAQTLGNCSVLQYVQSMEIDPNTGLMYVIDTGRTGIAGTGTTNNLCPAKLVIYDLKSDSMVDLYEFPDSVVSRTRNFMNDIVLEYVNDSVRFVYITDVLEGKLYTLDLKTRLSYALEDQSMKSEGGNNTIITMNGVRYEFNVGIDGIAMSHDFKYLYYCPIGGYSVYQIPTSALHNQASSTTARPSDSIRRVGHKVSQSDGMAYSSNDKRLYFGAMGLNALYFWDMQKDEQDQSVEEGQVNMTTQTKLVANDTTMQWIDTFAFDGEGWLWFVSNRLPLFNTDTMDFSGKDGANMRVWRVFVNQNGYLDGAKKEDTDEAAVIVPTSVTIICALCLSSLFL